MARSPVHVALLVSCTETQDPTPYERFSMRMAEDAKAVLEEVTETTWAFHRVEASHLTGDEPRLPSDFLDEASDAMSLGPYDVVVVVTNVPLVSRKRKRVPGLASEVGRVVVISPRHLTATPRGVPSRALDSDVVRWNAAQLFLHLMGHLLGLSHRPGTHAMAPFRIDDQKQALSPFSPDDRARIRKFAKTFPEDTSAQGDRINALGFHLVVAFKHPSKIVDPLIKNRAPILPLALPSLTTAAIAPTILLVFTVEMWDVAINMPDAVAWTLVLVSIFVATWYLTTTLDLFFPRRERFLITEHSAAVNVTIFLTILLAMTGLFLMVMGLMLFIVFYIFPPGLMQTWPTLENPVIDTLDKIRLAAFIGLIGTITGALAGGLESRTIIHHFALFAEDV